MSSDISHLRAQLEERMRKHGLNQRSLALRAGLNATAVRDILKGKSKTPLYSTIQRLATALGCTPEDLMTPRQLDAVRNIERSLAGARQAVDAEVRKVLEQVGLPGELAVIGGGTERVTLAPIERLLVEYFRRITPAQRYALVNLLQSFLVSDAAPAADPFTREGRVRSSG
jgi:transcriptional regulator with XRE-family HTH domain